MITKKALALIAALGLFAVAGIATADDTFQDDLEIESLIAAEIQLENGSVVFVDETIDGIFGLGVLEVGRVDLGPLYELGATPLEIFLALAPEGAEPPAILFEAHERARAKDPGVSAEPRDFTRPDRATFLKGLPYHTFAVETDHCEEWGNVDYGFDPVIGNEPGTWDGYESNNAYSEFITWSMIPGGLWTSSSAYFDEKAELIDQEYTTPFGNDRALAMCVTYAELDSRELADCELNNTVDYRVRLLADAGAGRKLVAGWYHLTTFGEGVRYRSSSSGDRKYILQVVDDSVHSLYCKERYDVYTRSMNTLTYVSP